MQGGVLIAALGAVSAFAGLLMLGTELDYAEMLTASSPVAIWVLT